MGRLTRVLRISRTDSDERLLLHITQTSDKLPLDLKLVATEHEHLYHLSLKDSKLSTIRSEQYSGDDEELRNILIALFLHLEPESSNPGIIRDIELRASIDDEAAKVIIRRNIDGILQQIASIKLDQDDEREEVSAFAWVDDAVAENESLRADAETLQGSMTALQDQNVKMQSQIKDMIQTKKDHDEEMLQQFANLLNSKKQKIRELQRSANENRRASFDANDEVILGMKRKAEDDDVEMKEEEDEEDGRMTPESSDDDDTVPEQSEQHDTGSGTAVADEEDHDVNPDDEETEDEL